MSVTVLRFLRCLLFQSSAEKVSRAADRTGSDARCNRPDAGLEGRATSAVICASLFGGRVPDVVINLKTHPIDNVPIGAIIETMAPAPRERLDFSNPTLPSAINDVLADDDLDARRSLYSEL